MKDIIQSLEAINWQSVTENMNEKGFAVLKNLLSDTECEALKHDYSMGTLYRKTIVMERYRFGKGEYKYFNYPLPDLIQNIRQSVYPHLAPIANGWMESLGMEKRFPAKFADLQKLSHANKQDKPTVLILKYGQGGHNTLHQDLYGDVFFPLQLVLFLSRPNEDFTGGEFVMTQQTPRAQSKASVLQPNKGDVLIFTTNFRPVKGSRGYYRASMKHGVSELHEGERYTLGIIFHDALT